MGFATRAIEYEVPPRLATAASFLRIASFPPVIPENPYQRLLYEALEAEGCSLVTENKLKLDWLWRERGRVGLLHFHWPQCYYRYEGGGGRAILSWFRLGMFAARLGAARLLRYRIAWTIHQPIPHETRSLQLERWAGRILAHASSILIAHDETTATRAYAELGIARDRVNLVPHGSFGGAYRRGRLRDEVRAELGIAASEFVCLCFGHIRAYKHFELVLEAFGEADLPSAGLVVAGLPLDRAATAAIRSAAATDDRIRAMLEFVPDERVTELHDAADVAVIARSDGGTSGAIILALSLGLPVVAPDVPTYVTLTRGGELGWHFIPGNAASLASCLEAAARAGDEWRLRAAAAAASADGWAEIAGRTAALFRSAVA